MSKASIGFLIILIGAAYGSLVIDKVYDHTLGWLVQYNWVKPPSEPGQDDLRKLLGRKPTILLYASLIIIIGIFILWNRNS